jgi:hypothetical protein
MPKLYIELIDRLGDAGAALREAADAVGDLYGLSDELFDKACEASETAARLAGKLQDRADTYGEMAHNGLA